VIIRSRLELVRVWFKRWLRNGSETFLEVRYMITMQEIEPLAICMATQNLFEKRFRMNFGDNIILRSRDPNLEPAMVRLKRELNSGMTESKYLEGHKMNIVYNMDRIIALAGRYSKADLRIVENVVTSGKEMIPKVLAAQSFEDIGNMEAMFKSQILLPMYELFIKQSKR
jgi:hypothetical protein